MKILAIRGSNLASLAGEFEIDLSRGPLADAGVFAIVGNTGAGKSTLLDALCVALFDRTPRLTNHSRVVVGRGDGDPATLGAYDVRTLLRRGAAGGYAEVDFEAGDARRYRARWAVRRARDKADGTLQDQTLSLIALDSSERLGGTKTETLKAITARLGLSFDQFRRSALLAQGEFAAFLRADGKDRSELLERMTGTEIYSRLSIAAHQRAAAAEQHLRDIRAAANAIVVLDDSGRAAALAAAELAGEARRAARQRLDAAEAAARWLAEQAARTAACDAARADHQRAIAAVAAAEPARTELALRRRVARLRGPLESVVRVERELAGCHRDIEHSTGSVERLIAAEGVVIERQHAIDELLGPIRSARVGSGVREPDTMATDDRGPDRRGDVPRGTQRGSAEPDSRTSRQVARDDASADVPRGTSTNDGSAHAVTLGRATMPHANWLAARSGLSSEIAAWETVAVRFDDHAGLGAAIGGLDRAIAAHGADRSAQLVTRGLVAADHRAAGEVLAEAERDVRSFHDRRGLAPDAARRLEDEARQRTSDAEKLVAIAEGARASADLWELATRRCAELDHEQAGGRERGRTIETELEAARALRTERERVLDELRRAAGLTHARAELVEGEPCPLCGAVEHPWRDRGALDEVVAAAQARRDEVVERIGALEHEEVALGAAAQQRKRERVVLEGRREVAATAIEAATDEWRTLLRTLGELVFEDDPRTPAAEQLAADRLATARRQLEAARDQRHQTEAAAKAAADAHARVQLARTNVDALVARLADIDRAVAELDAALQRHRGERSARIQQYQELDREVTAVVERWCAIESAATARTITRLDLDDPRAWMAALYARWQDCGQRVRRAESQLAAARAAIDHERRGLEADLASERARTAELAKRRSALADELASARMLLDELRRDIGITDAELVSLARPIGNGAGELPELERLVAVLADEARVETLAAQLADLEGRVLRTRAIVGEREQLLADHERSRPGSAVLDDARTIETIGAALAAAEDEAARASRVIASDDEARARRDLAFAQLASDEQRVEIDRVLGGVIGSHDGKLFRSFAQSLTLDGLLAVANAHLDELAPRYQLERIPRHDLEIQVIDRDLGDEVRSVQSLSGGESFLVSLALALGLSSMSAHDVRVRTLLIDEGFGTLDPATLDAALATLDALQATGRQIGVISHVPALVERVGAHVRVIQRGGGRSDVVVRA